MRVRYRRSMGEYAGRRGGRVPRRERADAGNRSINLTKNSQFYVRQGDVERLIQQGYLQRLD